MTVDKDSVFAGTVPRIYDSYLVPLIFQSYAIDIARRLSQNPPARVLEIACGTGVATRALAAALPPTSAIIASDLNQPMLDHAQSRLSAENVEWRRADAMSLPFEDGEFDAVVCQFGAMFFPDKPKAFAEAVRVLSPGGTYIFSVWDRIEDNEIADIVTAALATVFPDDPPRFMVRTPHGYHDVDVIRDDLARGGIADAQVETIADRSCADSPRDAAIAYCHGTPLRDEIFARDPSRVNEATDAAERAVEKVFGTGAVDAKMQAHIVTVQKS
jgi:SAM-dependent methyltransferase